MSQLQPKTLTAAQLKDIAFEVGKLLDDSEADEAGRIHVNPILQYIRTAVGKECRMRVFLERNEPLLKELADRYGSADIVKSEHGRSSGGTW